MAHGVQHSQIRGSPPKVALIWLKFWGFKLMWEKMRLGDNFFEFSKSLIGFLFIINQGT